MPLRVLIVDDDTVARTVLARVIEGLGHVVVQHDAAFGTTLLVQSERPDVVVVDVNLPGLSGPQLVQIAKRRKPGEDGRTPIFALYSSIDERELLALGAAVGAAGVLPKALRPSALGREFQRIVARAAVEAADGRTS